MPTVVQITRRFNELRNDEALRFAAVLDHTDSCGIKDDGAGWSNNGYDDSGYVDCPKCMLEAIADGALYLDDDQNPIENGEFSIEINLTMRVGEMKQVTENRWHIDGKPVN